MSIQKLSTLTGAGSTIPAAGRFAAVSGGTTSTYTDSGVTYQVQTFTASGTLTVASSGLVDILIIGGGGGGSQYGAGGGGGGHLFATSGYFSAGTYTVVVGAGGAAGPGGTIEGRFGRSGGASVCGSYVSPGGGSGGSSNTTGWLGGSGGGGSELAGAGGAGISGIGNSGGAGASASAGGGGGAGAAGAAGTTNVGGAGGNGLSSSINGTATTRAGGGGGGAWGSTGGAAGSGGGGAGSSSGSAGAGTVNTGGGGGGSGAGASAAGGSGIVIVRTVTAGAAPSGVVASGGTQTTYTGNGTNGVNGRNYVVQRFNANGTLTVTQPGYADVLIVSGGSGGGGEYASSGAGGGITFGNVYLGSGSYSVVVGAGSTLSGATATGNPGGIGGTSYLGQYGSPLSTSYSTSGPNAPLTSTITGSSVTYAQTGTAVTANTGNGGIKAGCCGAPPGALGSSGVVIVRYEA